MVAGKAKPAATAILCVLLIGTFQSASCAEVSAATHYDFTLSEKRLHADAARSAYQAILKEAYGAHQAPLGGYVPFKNVAMIAADLNGDGRDDYVVALDDYCGSFGCLLHLALSERGKWRVVSTCANYQIQRGIDVLPIKTNGLKDIALDEFHLAFDGESYCRKDLGGRR